MPQGNIMAYNKIGPIINMTNSGPKNNGMMPINTKMKGPKVIAVRLPELMVKSRVPITTLNMGTK